ncbi:MAG: riboflavin synthase [Roseibacillus sp.]|nr:riboflavin synthase [Roseibacillus sp.]
MFTGLIESTGRTVSLETRGQQARLTIEAPFSTQATSGDSVAVNGCCLTVVEQDDQTLTFDILTQTLEVTSLGALSPGALVNLERALRADDRLGGHFVQGHVDTTGIIKDLSPQGQDHRYEVSLSPGVYRYCIGRGSLAVDGISLTIAELLPESALFWITPHTFKATNLQSAQIGQKVNLEADLLAKYVESLTLSKPLH